MKLGAFIIPTGIGASIGGFAGDASYWARKFAEINQLIVNPNVVNAGCFSGITENMLYVEGYSLDEFFRGKLYLKEVKKNKVGVVFDPFTDSLYTAIRGKGAYKNGEKITVNDYELDDMKTVCHYDLWPEADYNISKVLQELGNKTYIIGLGSIIRACMCVASGDFTFAIFPGTKHKNCDIAAVKVIVEEAGGTVTDLFGNEQRYDESINGAVISNGKVHNEVTETVKKYLKDRK